MRPKRRNRRLRWPARISGAQCRIGVIFGFALLLGLFGCGLRRDRLTAPPNASALHGVVTRAGNPVPGESVKLYQDPSGALRDSSVTDAQGDYGFGPVPSGQWMAKVSSVAGGDLSYVRYIFQGPSSSLELPPMDLFAYGFDLLQPADSAAMPQPSIISPIHFAWSAYGAPYRWASARITDTLGVLVWQSALVPSTSADWNGVGNDGVYAGKVVQPGRYSWRVKLHLPNSVQAASRQRQIVIAP